MSPTLYSLFMDANDNDLGADWLEDILNGVDEPAPLAVEVAAKGAQVGRDSYREVCRCARCYGTGEVAGRTAGKVACDRCNGTGVDHYTSTAKPLSDKARYWRRVYAQANDPYNENR